MKPGFDRLARPAALYVLAAALACGSVIAEPVVFARHLSLSPDGQSLAFGWAGDIWRASADGGVATRLTAHPGNDHHPVWSRDGQRIAFATDRHGSDDVFVMNADGGRLRRMTSGDRDEIPSDWEIEDRAIVFAARMEGQLIREAAIYRVSADGGEPTRVNQSFGGEGAWSPDGRLLAFSRGSTPWWRKDYRGSANYELWLYNSETHEYRRLTRFEGNDRLPCWDAEGRGLYFLSDRDETMNVWYQPLQGEPSSRTAMTRDDVRDLASARNRARWAFTHWDKVYVSDAAGPPREIKIEAGGDSPLTPTGVQTLTNGADDLAVSPTGDEFAIVVRGEIFVGKSAEGKPTRRITDSAARDWQPSWSPDGKALYFTSDAAGHEQIYRAISAEQPARPLSESLRIDVQRVTDSKDMSYSPQVSPDGGSLAYMQLRGDLIVRELKSGTERRLISSWNPPDFAWSPDGKWLAYSLGDAEFNADVWIAAADGSGTPTNISRHPDNDTGPQWSADGQILSFVSNRIDNQSDLYLVFLSRTLDEKSTVDLNEYFEKRGKAVEKREPPKECAASGDIVRFGHSPPSSAPASAPASAPVATSSPASAPADYPEWFAAWLKENKNSAGSEKKSGDQEKSAGKAADEARYEYHLENAYERIRRVTTLPGDQAAHALSPDGKTLVFASSHNGSAALYRVQWNGEELKEIAAGEHRAQQYTLNGKRIFYLKNGVPGSIAAGGGEVKGHPFRGKLDIQRADEARQKFDDAARQMGLRFYHPDLKGLNWPELTEKYRELAIQTRSYADFNEVFNMLLGELNGSHLGISGPGGGGSGEATGYLGCGFDRAFPGPGLRIVRVLPNSPADRDESRLFAEDVILAIGGVEVGPQKSAADALMETVGDSVILRYLPGPQRAATQPSASTQPAASAPASSPADPSPAELVIRPISFGAFNDLAYEDWVRRNREYVERQSQGRLGYLHIRAMGEAEFYRFERDLYAAAHGRDGLIIDVRNNGGGFTADWVLQVLMVQRHAFTMARAGERGYPQDRLVFYAWTKPATMMCNEYSYSNAEIISHAFKNLKRGPLVGNPTHGAVISTGSYGLIDGARIRMPARGWYTIPEGVDMELHGAVPDVIVDQTPADEEAGREPQLDAAIRATLAQLS